ncbi:heavy metal translocating P-type ATPase [Helicobacter muridarum]|uniref:P-type Zn(2+) transporter n=1 Tax=Helicobacter muridarum TaxID=216 RepID=A0A099TZG0_9HELI|nr:heavy metal translocating P-type ATPase [Helicobacter muridarum]TLD99785.1 heavy metal translocating P-type ATPase [Helicobacter muridarum]STQ86981.1 cation transport ATPase [Helicobacter muridarum]
MQKFKLYNLDCTNCANKIEKKLSSLPYIKTAKINFQTGTLYIQERNEDNKSNLNQSLLSLLQKDIHEVESKVQIKSNQDSKYQDENDANKNEGILLLILISLFGFGLFAKYSDMIFTGNNEDSKYLLFVFFLLIYFLSGKQVFENTYKNLKNKIFFDENSLMFFATFAAICIGEVVEAVAVMIFFKTGELVESLAISKSRNSLNTLMQIIPNIAHKKTLNENELEDIHPEILDIDDVIVVKVGEKIPVDGMIIKGSSHLDMRIINGEPKPLSVKPNDKVIAGAININSPLEIRVEARFQDSNIAKIQDMIENAADNKAKTQKLITRFAKVYMPIIFVFALCIAIIPPFFLGFTQEIWLEWIYRALVVLMVSCPCALVISAPLGYFGAIGIASRHGILVKGSNYLEALANTRNIIFDKTGTLTKGEFAITQIKPNNISKEELLGLASCAESLSNHPIANSIRQAAKTMKINYPSMQECEEISGKGILATYNDKGQGKILIGSAKLLKEYNIDIILDDETNANPADTIIYVATAKIDIDEWQYVGCIHISDSLKDEAKECILKLKELGIANMAILSGDNQASTQHIAKLLTIDRFYGNLLPNQKAEIFSSLKKEYEITTNSTTKERGRFGDSEKIFSSINRHKNNTAFIGDGINDCVVLSLADVGISISGSDNGSNDISKQSADIILTSPTLHSLTKSIEIAKKTQRITWQNIYFALSVKLAIVALGVAGIADMWLAVFGDVGVALLALANALRCAR